MPRYALAVVLALAGCEEKSDVHWGSISSFAVTITSGDPGSKERRIPPVATGTPFELHIQAINGRGEPMSWSGQVALSATPGRLEQASDTIGYVLGGTGSASVVVGHAFGPTRIWVEDVGTESEPGSFATGLTETIWFAGLRLKNIQQTDDPLTSPLVGQRPVVRDGTMIVTRVSSDGFYVTDIDDRVTDIRETEWSSIFAFNYSVPENLERGDLLVLLEGAVQEFYGLTELSFPVWEVGGHVDVPPPVPLDCVEDLQAGGLAMERWEAALIEVTDAVIRVCESFPICPDLAQYGQWVIELSCGAELNVISRVDVPVFEPADNRGRSLDVIRGVLRQHQFATPQWILEPRDPDDICCPTCTPVLREACP